MLNRVLTLLFNVQGVNMIRLCSMFHLPLKKDYVKCYYNYYSFIIIAVVFIVIVVVFIIILINNFR